MGLYENIREEQVNRLALREPAVVSEDATVRDAVLAMRDRNLGCAIALNEERQPLGMLTESSLTRKLSQGVSFIDEPVRDHLESNWPTLKLTDPILVVLDALETRNVRFLIVVDEEGKLAGLTGQKGLMEYVADHFPQQVIVNRVGCKPYPADREGA